MSIGDPLPRDFDLLTFPQLVKMFRDLCAKIERVGIISDYDLDSLDEYEGNGEMLSDYASYPPAAKMHKIPASASFEDIMDILLRGKGPWVLLEAHSFELSKFTFNLKGKPSIWAVCSGVCRVYTTMGNSVEECLRNAIRSIHEERVITVQKELEEWKTKQKSSSEKSGESQATSKKSTTGTKSKAASTGSKKR